MKVCCIVETVFQLMNILNLLINDKEYQGAEIDLFVRKGHFAHYDEYCERIRDKGLFHEINYFKFQDYSKSNFINHLRHVMELFWAKTIISKAISKDYDFKANDYDIVLAACACQFYKMALLCCKKAKFYAIEDGTLTYCNFNWSDLYLSPLSKILLSLYGLSDKLQPKRLYLNHPEKFSSTIQTEVLNLPNFNDSIVKHKSLFEDIFGKPTCDYQKTKVVFAAQPAPVPETMTSQITHTMPCEYICRYHPRNSQDCDFGGQADRGSSQWELICAEYLTDNHILVGGYSTAMLTPKWFFDREPYLLFIYPIYSEKLPSETLEACKKIVSEIKKSYREPSKIFVVNDIRDLNELLVKLTTSQ